jgi:hypothetical protein
MKILKVTVFHYSTIPRFHDSTIPRIHEFGNKKIRAPLGCTKTTTEALQRTVFPNHRRLCQSTKIVKVLRVTILPFMKSRYVVWVNFSLYFNRELGQLSLVSKCFNLLRKGQICKNSSLFTFRSENRFFFMKWETLSSFFRKNYKLTLAAANHENMISITSNPRTKTA